MHDPIPIDRAQALIAARIRPLGEEPVPLDEAPGRFLSRPVEAPIDLPQFDNSAMDGYAVRAADTPGRLTVIGESAAGAPFAASLQHGQAVRISTGAVLPDGADAVAPIEDVTTDSAEIEIPAAVAAGAYVRYTAGDVSRGAQLLAAGTRIGPAQIGALAAVGLPAVRCHRRPRVAVFATGTELRPSGADLKSGEIFNSNGPMLRAALHSAGALVEPIPAAVDTVDAHLDALTIALQHDVVITTGGVSVGDHDLVREAARRLGVEELFWRVALRPGKPLAFGVRGDTLVFGLPGNPVSTLVCFELFVRPALLALQGARDPAPELLTGALARTVRRNPSRDDFIRVRIRHADGTVILDPLPDQQSHQIVIAAQADALARIPTGDGELLAGTQVSFLPI